MELKELKPGDRFRKWDGRTGTVLHVSFCRVRVRLDTAEKKRIVKFESSRDAREVEFVDRRAGVQDLAPGTEIEEVLGRVALGEEEKKL